MPVNLENLAQLNKSQCHLSPQNTFNPNKMSRLNGPTLPRASVNSLYLLLLKETTLPNPLIVQNRCKQSASVSYRSSSSILQPMINLQILLVMNRFRKNCRKNIQMRKWPSLISRLEMHLQVMPPPLQSTNYGIFVLKINRISFSLSSWICALSCINNHAAKTES